MSSFRSTTAQFGKKLSRQRGAEIIELAFTLVYFIIIIMTIIEGSRLVYSYTSTNYLAREAVRYAVVRGSKAKEMDTGGLRTDVPVNQDHIRSFIRNQGVLQGLKDENIIATFSDDQYKKPGSTVTVSVSYPFATGVPLLSIFNFTLSSSAQGTMLF